MFNKRCDGFTYFSFNYIIFIGGFKSFTGRLFKVLGFIHDIDFYRQINNVVILFGHIFSSHWGHFCIIFLWFTAFSFHIAWSGNYFIWIKNPLCCIPLGHSIWDLHFSFNAQEVYLGHSISYGSTFCTYTAISLL